MSEFIPQEIIVEILPRLPVKPLCRFKCVSKLWLMLITDPKFIETHRAKRQHQTLIVASGQQLFSVSFEPFELKGGSICDLVALELDHPLKSKAPDQYNVQIFGFSNGLFCLLPRVVDILNVQPPNVFIFNPCIGMFKQVPVHAVSIFYVYGFGYAPSIDDYKLIKICVPSCLVAVYSLKMNSWKTKLKKFPHRAPNEPGTSVNGVVHWVVRRRSREGGVRRFVIAAFDVANECFKEVDIPDDDLSNDVLVLGALNGCLCLCRGFTGVLANKFWIMREYGVKESWCKIVMDVSYKSMKPMCLMKNGEALLLINKERFVLCDLKDGKCADFVVRGLPNEYGADVCVETLVSPNLIKGLRVASDHVNSVSRLRV